MSILLSVYFREGIVFVADKNATLVRRDHATDVEVGLFTKVLAWPQQRAVIGFCGLGQLGGLAMDDWLRIFIAGDREFDDLAGLAERLRTDVERDFRRDLPEGTDLRGMMLILHLGGYRTVDGHCVPAMYYVRNWEPHEPGIPPTREFRCSDEVERLFREWGADDYPQRTRERLAEMVEERQHFLWFNNGYRHDVFNLIKAHVWELLSGLRQARVLPAHPSLDHWTAYCRVAVELYGVILREHYLPHERVVGGGVDSVSIPWPATPPG